MAKQPAVRIELLGGFRALTDGRPLARLPTARQQQLIAFLVLHAHGTPVQRQRVAGSLWPESTDPQALTNLRRELHHLREDWPSLDALIDAGTRTLTWRNAHASVDLTDFDAAAERGVGGDRMAMQEAARLYRGDLLPDVTGEWIDPDRERLRLRAQQVLARLVDLLEQQRAFADAIEYTQQRLRLDPLDEQAWCALMRCHARRGERATALHVYQQCAALLKKELGVPPSAATRLTYREILDVDPETPIAPAPPRAAAYPLVGRHIEWQTLLNAWHAAATGRSRLFVIRGEAGIGKTRLAEELIDWCGLKNISTVTARCYAGEGRLAYAPIASWLKSHALQPTLMTMDGAWLTDVARIHPELIAARPEVPAPDRQLESWQRLRFFEAVAQVFRSAAPLVLIADDLHWADADTIEWLQYFLRSASETSCLIVATIRAEEEQDNAALTRLLAQLEQSGVLSAVSLGALDSEATAQLAAAVMEQQLDAAAQALTFRETEGHPLFIVERGRMNLASQSEEASAIVLPRVQSVVAARLALLSEEARAAAEVAAAVGRDFSFDILAHASDLEEDVLVRALDELWRRHIVRVQSEERWDFSHDRIREVAYSSIGPARRRLIHRRIAQGMELLFANHLDEVSASVAMHLERGGQAARAVPFLERAASVSTRVSAHREAIRCLTHALTLLDTLPAGQERDERELALRSSLSIALNSTHGYAAPEVEQNLNRVFDLSRAEGRGHVPVRWLWVAFTFRFMQGDFAGAREVSELALERSMSDPSCRCEAHHAMGGLLSCLGELDASRDHFEAALAAYDERHPQQSALGSDLGVFAHAWGSHSLWLLGEEHAALDHADRAIALARRRDHTFSLTLALAYAALLHQMRGDLARTREAANAAVTLSERYEFGYYGDWARVLIGWAHGQERPAEGIAIIETALAQLDAQRAQARRPYFLSLLAEICNVSGDRKRAESILDSSIAMALKRGDRWWLPAMYLQQSDLQHVPRRDATLRLALETARSQGSKGLERRILAAAPAERGR